MSIYDVTSKEILIGNLMRLMKIKEFYSVISLYKKRFKKPLKVIFNNKFKQYPFVVELSDNEIRTIQNFGELFSILYQFDYDSQHDIITLKKNGLNTKLKGGITNGEIVGIFYNEDYKFLDVKDKDVIDIGANIGDSSIYFALQGANRIIALEPFSKNYENARINLEINNLNNKITLLQAACDAEDGFIFLDDSQAGVYNNTFDSEKGKKIRSVTLKTILENFDLDHPVLKIDCEGCEYSILLSTPDNILKRIVAIQIEYHYGYTFLCKRLIDLGFDIQYTKPRYRINKFVTNANMYVGWIYARNKAFSN